MELSFDQIYSRCIEDRLDAISEISESDAVIFKKMRELLSNLPDLEKALTSVIHGKVNFVLGLVENMNVHCDKSIS